MSSKNTNTPPSKTFEKSAWLCVAVGLGGANLSLIFFTGEISTRFAVLSFSLVLLAGALGLRVAYRKQLLQSDKDHADLEKKLDHLTLIFESTPIGMNWISYEFEENSCRVVDSMHNPAHYKITGLTEQESAKKGVFEEITHPEDLKKQQALLAGLNAREYDQCSMEKRYLRKDGSTVWVGVSWLRQWSDDGKHCHQVSSLVDITANKQAGALLQRREKQLSFVFESCPVGLVWVYISKPTQDAFPERLERLVNPAHQKVTGLTREECDIPGMFMKITHPEDVDLQEEGTLQMDRREIDSFSVVKRYIMRDGSIKWVKVTWFRLYDDDGKHYQELSTLLDITENRKRLAEVSQAQAAAESAAIAKSQFLATMSHEIRTPMNGMIGVLELLKDVIPEKSQKLLATANKSADHLLALINDILDFSKIEAGKMKTECVEFDALALVEEACDLHAASAYEKDLEIVCSVKPNDGYIAFGDPLRIRQIVSNLVSNAVKFTSAGDVVSRMKFVDSPTKDRRLRIEIVDSGIGIPKSAHDRIFRSFSQAEESTTKEFGGTGLGLAICKKLIELMGGEIGFDSVAGQGTTFWFEVPQEKTLKQSAYSIEKNVNSPMRGMVIEENDATASTIVSWLQYWGLEVELATTLEGAIALCEAQKTTKKTNGYDFTIADESVFHSHDWNDLRRKIEAFSDSKLITMRRVGGEALAQSKEDGRTTIRRPVHVQDLRENIFVCEREKSKATASVDKIARYESLKALLVDDNLANRTIASTLFIQRYGFKPDLAVNGIEALEYLSKNEYDIVFMDCNMPEMDGFEASRQVRAGAAGEKSKDALIVALTANAFEEDKEECLKAGMSDFLAKPLRPVNLSAVLAKWFDEQSVRRGAPLT